MQNSKVMKKILVCILPFVVIAILYFVLVNVLNNVTLPQCLFNKYTGLYCPGCGGTRAVFALLHADISLSLRENAFVVVTLICIILLYIEYALKVFGINLKLPFSKTKVLFVLLALWGVYCVIRNIVPMLAPI